MFGSIGGPEMVVILIVALLIFGPRRLPALARSLGKAMTELRRASQDFKTTLEREVMLAEAEDKKESGAGSPPATTSVEAANATASGGWVGW
ncbi:MAG: Sec-independent protein translocase protein TatB [Acidobacteriota bacterium]